MPNTLHYGIPYPDGSSSLAPLQTWFQNVAVGVDDALYNGLVNITQQGTTVQRDAYWGTPVSAADRIALAAKVPRWFNNDKGYEQQYFAATADAGSGRYARTTAGWYPAIGMGGLVPIRPTAITAGSGTAVFNGGRVDVASGWRVALDGVFSADFDQYEVYIGVDSMSVDTAMYIGFRTGGVDNVVASYYYTYNETTAGGANTPAANGANALPAVARAASTGGVVRATISNPFQAKRTSAVNASGDNTGYARTGAFGFNLTTSFDGMYVATSGSGVTGTFNVKVFGVNDY